MRAFPQEAGEGRLLIPAQLKLLKNTRRRNGLRWRRNMSTSKPPRDKPRCLRRDGRLSEGAFVRPRDARRDDGPASIATSRLGDGGRTELEMHFPEEGVVLLARVALVGKVHARHQGADGKRNTSTICPRKPARACQEKAEQGIWPTKTPLGYRNIIRPGR